MQVSVAGLRRNLKNFAHCYSNAQVKVRAATSNDPWGPSGTQMSEIADLTYSALDFPDIMQIIWKRLNDTGKNWRHVYKALILLDYLIKNGSERVAQQCRENLFVLKKLHDFIYFEECKDQGKHVREKSTYLVNLLRDKVHLKNERIKALRMRERFTQNPSAFGNDNMPVNCHRDTMLPQTTSEEELQIQLAVAMSCEEAEKEEAKRRDDVRLQMALYESEKEYKEQEREKELKRQKEETQNHLMDMLDFNVELPSTSRSSPFDATITDPTTSDAWVAPVTPNYEYFNPWAGVTTSQFDPWEPVSTPNTSQVTPNYAQNTQNSYQY